MAVPITVRDDDNFSPLGIINAAVLGLLDPNFNQTTDIQAIPNMDGFPNGRRLEDDVTLIELQAVAGAALAAIGLWYDDYTAGDPNPVTQDLLDVLGYRTGVNKNDREFGEVFPYLAPPNSGTGECSGIIVNDDGGAGNNGCPDEIAGFEYLGEFDGSKYYFSNDVAQPAEAQDIAMMNNGNLAVINSEQENAFIQSKISELAYIGLNDAGSEGNLEWVDGSAVNFSNFDICNICEANTNDKDYVIIHSWNGGWSWSSKFSARKYVLEVVCNSTMTLSEDKTTELLKEELDKNAKVAMQDLGITTGKIFPNPASDQINVSFKSKKGGNVSISIFDLNGKEVLRQSIQTQIGDNQMDFNINALSPGIYFIHIQGNKGDSSQFKFVKN